jgi:hypothetical protein
MENSKTKSKTNKTPRSIIMAENWKNKEIKHILELRDEMLANNIDDNLIKKYIDEQYDKINQEYETKIKKYYDKQKKLENKSVEKDVKQKRDKAVQFLLKNKNFLEENGASKEYIKKYVDIQYNMINLTYNIDYSDPYDTINLELVNFIDL